jgi:hypothetical protein
LITGRGGYIHTNHTGYRTSTTPEDILPGDRWEIGPTASVLEPLGGDGEPEAASGDAGRLSPTVGQKVIIISRSRHRGIPLIRIRHQ